MNWEQLLNNLTNICVDIVLKLLAALIILIIGRIIIKFIVKKLTNGMSEKADPMVTRFTVAFVKIALYVILVVSIVAILGVPMASIIAVIGSVGVAISLAVQGTLGNLASGLMLCVFKPFHIGDFIESGSHSGTVTDMGVFYTTLTAPDNRTIVVPNSSLTGATLVNYSTQKNRRLDINFNVDYKSDVEKVKQTALEVVSKHSEVLADPAPFIRMTEMNESSICMTLRIWCDGADYWGLKFNILEEMLDEFNKRGIVIPFPQLSVHVDK